jgi:hypothetical protein
LPPSQPCFSNPSYQTYLWHQLGEYVKGLTYILHEQAAVKGLAWPFAPEQRFSHRTCRSVAPNDIVGGESFLLFGISFSCLDFDPSMVCVLTNIDDRWLNLTVTRPLIFSMQSVSLHDLDDLVEWQNCHTVGMVFHYGQVDPRESLAITDSSPVNTGEAGDALLPDVVEDPCSAEDLGCWNSIL